MGKNKNNRTIIIKIKGYFYIIILIIALCALCIFHIDKYTTQNNHLITDKINAFFTTHDVLTSFLFCFVILVFLISIVLLEFFIKRHRRSIQRFRNDNKLIFIFLLLYILFYQFWEKLIGDYVIDKFLCFFDTNLLNDIIFIAAVLISAAVITFHKGLNINQRAKLICVIAILFWVYYRWRCHLFGPQGTQYPLYFKPLYLTEHLKYVDFVPLLALCGIIPSILKSLFGAPYFKSKYNEERNPMGYIIDNPIKAIQDDTLKRDSFVTSAIQKLLNTDTVDGAYTFGINSPWGAGKTSFMNLMKEQIQNTYSNYRESILIDFNPWLYAAEQDLVTAFFDELSKYLKQYDHSLAKDIIDYSKLLSAFGTKETKMIASLIDLTRDNHATIQKKKDRITNTLRRIRKPIFVFIDDFDRLDADELMEMMKLIRNISDFPFMYFIAAYDKAYLVECLDKRMNLKGSDFVEKIFQHEFHLPPSPSEILRNKLYDLIVDNEAVKNREPDKQTLEQYIKNDYENPLSALSNLREVKRLANHFYASYRYVIDDINVIDLLLIELIKTKYPLVFAFFQRKKDAVLITDSDKQHYHLYQGKNDINNIDFIKYIKLHSKEFKISDIDKLYVETIFRLLFPDLLNPQSEDGKNINKKIWFNRYINLTEMESDISTADFEKALKKDIDGFHKSMDQWLDDHKSYALRCRIMNHNDLFLDERLKLLEAAFYFMSKDKDIEFTDIDKLVGEIIKLTPPSSMDGEREFIKTILLRYGNSRRTREYIGHLYNNRILSEIILNQEITLIQQKILQGFFDDDKKTTFDVHCCFIELLSGNSQYLYYQYVDYYKDNKKLIQLMKKYVEDQDHIVQYIPITIYSKRIKTGSTGFGYALAPIVDLIWGSRKTFFEYINGLDDSNSIISEFKKFLVLYKNNNYKPTTFRFESFDALDMIIRLTTY